MTVSGMAQRLFPRRGAGAAAAALPPPPGGRLQGLLDRVIASSSAIATDPVLDVRDFPWTARLREQWRDVRAEALTPTRIDDAAPAFYLSGTDARSAAVRALPLWQGGCPIDVNLARFPMTARALNQVPGLIGAAFSWLAPGVHLAGRRGISKGLVTCHLGLIVPTDGDVRMRLGGRILRWAEGETLIFDDTCRHEIWNETGGDRMVLALQFERPLRRRGRWIAAIAMRIAQRAAVAQTGIVDDQRRRDA